MAHVRKRVNYEDLLSRGSPDPVGVLLTRTRRRAGHRQEFNINDNNFAMTQANWVVGGKVKTSQGDPVRGATVTVTPLTYRRFPNRSTDAQGDFRTQYQLMSRGTVQFSAILTAKKKGFQTAHAFVNYGRSGKTWAVPLTLHGLGEDPDLLSSADLISGLAPKLKQLGPADGLAAKSEKITRGAWQNFSTSTIPSEPCRVSPKWWQIIPRASGAGPCWALRRLGWCDWNDAHNSLRRKCERNACTIEKWGVPNRWWLTEPG